MCAKLIAQAGIKTVKYNQEYTKPDAIASRKILTTADIDFIRCSINYKELK